MGAVARGARFVWTVVAHDTIDDPPGGGLLSAAILLAVGVSLLLTRKRPRVEPEGLVFVGYSPAEPSHSGAYGSTL